ncbi:hypothetical protein SprV_0401399900 [Sparganum proliferum]
MSDDKPTEAVSAAAPVQPEPEAHEDEAKEPLDTTPLAKALDEVEGKEGKDGLAEEHAVEKSEVTEEEEPKEDSEAAPKSETVKAEEGKKEEEDKSEEKAEEA